MSGIVLLFGGADTGTAPASAPSTPTGLSAVALGPRNVALYWTDASPALSADFEIQRKINGQLDSTYITVEFPSASGVAAMAETDESAQPSTAYIYRIRARNDVGSSGFLVLAVAVTTPADPGGGGGKRLTGPGNLT